jgi:predicted MPP superfamily phosphohydrolase
MTKPSRDEWRKRRLQMEARREKHSPRGGREIRHWVQFSKLVRHFGRGIKLFGLYQRGVRNALDIRLTRLELAFDKLPAEFDGYRILQLSDLHFDALPGTTYAASKLVKDLEVDLCVLTGDYCRRVGGPFDHILPDFRDLVARISATDGIYAVLGNHDAADMVDAIEGLGIAALINESVSMRRGDAEIHITGTDDVHYYYTDATDTALKAAPDGFKIALIHSAELADVAANNGFDLYLAGHTHGGQVCLPGGTPMVTHMVRFRRYARGLWRHGSMVGYTSTGVGISALPVRYFNRGEVVLLTLRRRAK